VVVVDFEYLLAKDLGLDLNKKYMEYLNQLESADQYQGTLTISPWVLRVLPLTEEDITE
jgi:hypothetical protein